VPISQGGTVLALAGSAHGFLNRYEEPARLLFVYPTHHGFEPSVPGYGELGRIWARAIARSPGWLTWPLLLGERFPHTGAA
jgi:hypothetical protein